MKFLKLKKHQGTERGSRITTVLLAVDSIEKIEDLYSYAKITFKGKQDYILASSVQNVLDALNAFVLPAGVPETLEVKGDA